MMKNTSRRKMEPVLEPKPRVSFEFEIEKIIGISNDGRYQVKWAPAWVSKFHLVGCEHLIQEFLQEQSEMKIKVEPEDHLEVSDEVTAAREEGEHFNGEFLQVHANEKNLELEFQFEASDVATREIDQSDRDVEVTQIESNNLPSVVELEQNSCSDVEILPLSDDHLLASMEFIANTGCIENKQEQQPQAQETGCLNKSTGELVHPQNELQPSHLQQNDNEIYDPTNATLKYDSDICQKPFLNSYELERHHQFGEKQFECPHCTKKFIRKYHLDRHIRSHTGEQYLCDHCDFSCNEKCYLVDHVRKHTGEKPFSCDVCGKTFARKSYLNTHIRIHTGVKPYGCGVCGKAFSDRSSCCKHMKSCSRTAKLNNISSSPEESTLMCAESAVIMQE